MNLINFSRPTAPIRSEVDDISLFIINFEDLSDPQMAELVPSEEQEPMKQLSKCKFSSA